jgi:uncharacterized protein YbjT (DUF2867 family)
MSPERRAEAVEYALRGPVKELRTRLLVGDLLAENAQLRATVEATNSAAEGQQ